MKIQGMTIENYGSFLGEHRIELADRGLVFVAGANEDEPKMLSNGAGKSTLFDALEWALFGEVPKADAADSIVSEQASGGTVVTVWLDDARQPVTIQRFRKVRGKSGVRLWVGVHGIYNLEGAQVEMFRSNELTTLDVRETQALIEDLLGLDREVFRAAVYRAQTETFNFADATDAERKDMLTRILGLGELDIWLDRAKSSAADIARGMQAHEAKLGAWRAELAAIDLARFDADAQRWEAQRETRLQRLRERYIEEQRRAEDLGRARFRLSELEFALESLSAPMPLPDATEPTYARVQAELADNRQRQLAVFARRDAKWAELKAMERNHAGRCSQCGQLVTAEHLKREELRLVAELEGLRAEAASYGPRIRELEQQAQALEKEQLDQQARYQDAHTEYAVGKRELELEIARVRTDCADHARLARELESVVREGQELKAELNPFAVMRERAVVRVAELGGQIQALELELRSQLERQRLLEFWVYGFGPKGLKSYVLDARLGELSDAANRYVKLLTGGTVWVRFETQTMAKTARTLSEKLNIRVFRHNPDGKITERSYRSWSGGEKARIALGIDFGLAGLVAQRASKSYGLLVLDEVFRHLDAKGREAVLELLQQLAEAKDSIFVIDHDLQFKGEFEHVMTVRKRGGRSEVLAS